MQTVLLVEDDELVRKMLHNLLEKHGYNLIEAQHAEEALLLSELHEGAIDFLVTDILMPGMDGFELSDRIRESRPDICRIFMSGYSRYAARADKFRDLPIFLVKPFPPKALLKAIINAPFRNSKAVKPGAGTQFFQAANGTPS